MVFIKYSPDGTQQWVKTFQLSGYTTFIMNDMVVDEPGNMYIIGSLYSSPVVIDWITLKYSTAGDIEWYQVAANGSNTADIPTSIATDSNGNVYSGGSWVGGLYGTNFHLIKYSAGGSLEWDADYDYANDIDYITDVTPADNGNVYVTGIGTFAGGDSYNAITIGYDGAGNQLWAKDYDQGFYFHEPGFINIDHAGNVIVAGSSHDYDITFGTFVLKYTPAGTLSWTEAFEFPNDYYGFDLAVGGLGIDSSNNIYIGGHSQYENENGDYFHPSYNLKIDSAGNQIWRNEFYGSDGTGIFATAMVGDDAGNSYVCGNNNIGGNPILDNYIVNSEGQVVWNKTYETYPPVSSSIAVDQSGNVIIGGQATLSTGVAMLTLKYCAPCGPLGEVSFINVTTSICAGTTEVPFNTNTLLNADSYTWNYSGSGVTISANDQDATLDFDANATSGMLTVKAINACDTAEISVSLNVFPLPVVSLQIAGDTFCLSAPAFILTGGLPLGGTYSGPGVSSGIFDAGIAGTGDHNIIYSYEDVNGCVNTDSQMVVVDVCTNATSFSASGFLLQITPNPSFVEAILHFNILQSSPVRIEIFDVNGKTIETLLNNRLESGDHSLLLRTASFSKGICFVKIVAADGIQIEKLIVQ